MSNLSMNVIACIEDPTVIKKILAHLDGETAAPAIGIAGIFAAT